MEEAVYQDLDLAEQYIRTTSVSIVVVKDQNILLQKQGDGIRPILETIDELGEQLEGAVVGDRILGKVTALLCAYAKVGAVYSPQATKTAIAVLIRAGIPGQTDEMIPFIKNRNGDDLCPFEKLLSDIDSPEEAYEVLTQYLKSKYLKSR